MVTKEDAAEILNAKEKAPNALANSLLAEQERHNAARVAGVARAMGMETVEDLEAATKPFRPPTIAELAREQQVPEYMREYLAGEKKPNIYQRMNAVMKEAETASKTRTNTFHKYRFIGHDDVTDAVRASMVKHGIVQHVQPLEVTRTGADMYIKVAIRWINMDDPEDSIYTTSHGESFGTKGNPDDLQYGKAISYAVKTALLKNFMLIGDDTPDNEATQRNNSAPTRTVEYEDEASEKLAADMIAQMGTCKSTDELDSIGKTLEPIATKLSKATREKLNAAWNAAELRLVG
jgi:hypothetical protein